MGKSTLRYTDYNYYRGPALAYKSHFPQETLGLIAVSWSAAAADSSIFFEVGSYSNNLDQRNRNCD